MKYNVLIFDVYNLFYKWSFMAEEKIVNINNKKTHIEGIEQYIRALNTYINKYGEENCKVYLCFDNAKTLIERHQIYDNYKSNRDKPPEWFYEEINYCELISKFFRDNTYVLRCPKYEADDFVEHIINLYTIEKDKVLMISGDMDWCRYLSDKVHQYYNKKLIDVIEFEQMFGFKPTKESVCFYKSFYGDVSDFFEGALTTFPKVYFNRVINDYKSIKLFINDAKNGEISYLDLGWKLKIEKSEIQLLNNYSLAEGAEITELEMKQHMFESSFKPNKLKIIYSTLGISNVDERIKEESKSSDIFDMLNGEDLKR